MTESAELSKLTYKATDYRQLPKSIRKSIGKLDEDRDGVMSATMYFEGQDYDVAMVFRDGKVNRLVLTSADATGD